jgi:DNA-binding XRE family transcriptional regulator
VKNQNTSNPIITLTTELERYMLAHNYSHSTLKPYKRVWQLVAACAEKSNQTEAHADWVIPFVRSHFKKNTERVQKSGIRAVKLLCDFQKAKKTGVAPRWMAGAGQQSTWELYRKIRQLYLVDKLSQRAIANILRVSRNTIRKYCEGAVLPDMRNKPGREAHLFKVVADDIFRLLEENKKLPRKERMSGTDIWKYLVREKGIQIGETTVRLYIRELRNSHQEVYLPLEHEPGDAIQFDWGEMKAYIDGVRLPVSVLCAVLPASGAICAFVYPDEKELSFLDGHIRVFEAYNGVSRRCVYDYTAELTIDSACL